MPEEIGFQLDVNEGNSQKTVKSFKAELKAAKEEAINMGRQFGEFSPEAVKAAKQLGKLKDEFQDLNRLADDLTDEKKFTAFAQLGGSIAGGFTAAQGAISLTTGDTKQFEKAMLKVQSAMALSQGLSQIADIGRQWGTAKAALNSFTIVQKANNAATQAAGVVQKLFTGAVDGTSKGFKVLKTGIAATGLGLLVVAIGYVVTNFGKLKEMLLNLIPGLAKVASFIGSVIDAVTDFVGVTSDASRAADKLKDSIAAQNDTHEKNIQLLEASGASSKEVRKLKNQMYEDELNNLRGVLRLGQQLSDDESKRFKDLKFQQELLKVEQGKEDRDAADAAKKKADDEAKQAAEKRAGEAKQAAAARKAEAKRKADDAKKAAEDAAKADEENKQRAIDALHEKQSFEIELLKAQGKEVAGIREKQIDTEIELLANSGGKFKDGIEKLEHEKAIIQAQAITDETKAKEDLAKEQAEKEADVKKQILADQDAAREDSLATDLQRIQEKYDAMKAVVKDNEQLLTAVIGAEAEAQTAVRKKFDDLAVQQKRSQVIEISDILSKASALAGKDTAVGKGLAIATATINTYQGASEAIKQKSTLPSPFDVVAKVVNVATVIATGLKTVKEIAKVNVPNGGGGAATPSISAPSVSAAPTMDGIQSTLLEKTNELAAGKDTLKAYVVESEITQKQERQRSITQTANF